MCNVENIEEATMYLATDFGRVTSGVVSHPTEHLNILIILTMLKQPLGMTSIFVFKSVLK